MKKILLISTTSMGLDGTTSVIMNYVKQTYECVKYDFVVSGRVDSVVLDELIRMKCNVFIFADSRAKKPLKYFFWLKKILKSGKYDVVHINGNSGTMYLEVCAAKNEKVPVRIAHCHSTSSQFPLIHKLLKPMLNRDITHAIACSDLAGKWLFVRSYTVLENAIDVNRFKFSAKKRDEYRNSLTLGDKFVIGHVGYMQEVKNHLFLLNVMKKIIAHDKNAHLLLVGDGILKPKIEQFIIENGLSEYVTLLGNRADVDCLYCAFDVFVLPSIYEGLPVTAVEAQVSGLPCVISDVVTRQLSITENVQYIPISETDVDYWVKAILEKKNSKIDRQSAFNAIEGSAFDVVSNAKKILRIYEN